MKQYELLPGHAFWLKSGGAVMAARLHSNRHVNLKYPKPTPSPLGSLYRGNQEPWCIR